MREGLRKLVWLVAIVLFVIGFYGLYERLAYGHRIADYGSYVTWGLWVAAYIYFIGLSAGAFFLSTLVYVFGVKKLERIGKLALWTAFACLIAALLSIWFDLGHMWRAWRIPIHWPISMMSWMAVLYSAYFILIVIEIWFAMRKDLVERAQAGSALCSFLAFGSRDLSPEALERDKKVLKVLGIIGIPLATAFHGGVGTLFAVVAAKHHWHSGLTPIVFLVGALLSGAGLLIFATYLWGPAEEAERNEMLKFMGYILIGLICFDFLLEIAEYLVGSYAKVPEEYLPIRYIIFGYYGKYWYTFWIVHFLGGVVLPILLASSRKPGAVALAGLLVAVTFLSVRLNIVIPGQVVPEIKGLEWAFFGPGLKYFYFPTLAEWLLTAWVTGLGMLIFLVGEKLLPITNNRA